MKKEITVVAEARETRGKNEARRTRVRGMIPAVIYGAFQDPVSIAVNPKDILQILRSKSGYNTIFNLQINGGETTPVMLVDEQLDPVKGTLLHADLKRIDLTKRIKVSVPVITQGEARGIKLQGGMLEVVNRVVEIECTPNEIPDQFVVDVTELMVGQNKRAADIALSGSMQLLSLPDLVIAHVHGLKAEEATPAGGTAEPEVAKKGKKEEEKKK